MKALELFYLLKEKIPYQSDEDLPFHESLKSEFDWYVEKIGELDKDEFPALFQDYEPGITLKKFQGMEKRLCIRILEAINEARNANYHLAYKKARSLLVSRSLLGNNLSDMPCNYLYRIPLYHISEEFYRVRYLNASDNDFPNHVKHCAFEKVHRLGNERFSLPGFPCLYLGSSLEVCKREVPERSDGGKKCCRAKYILQRDLQEPRKRCPQNLWVLKLVPPTDSPDAIDLFNFLLLYPLFLSCLTNKKHQEGTFHAEYIMPQLLLQFVREEDLLDGICYLSSHTKPGDNIADMINCVLPVKSVKDQGYDDEGLMKWFEIKEV